MNKTRTIMLAFLLFVYLQIGHVAYGTAPESGSSQTACKDQLEIFDMIRSKNYIGLDQALRACQDNYEQNGNAEIALFSAYEAFSTSYPSVEPALNEWVSKYPSSYVARAARGRYLTDKGSRARGIKLARDTTDEEFRAMENTLHFASDDFNEAIRLYPKCLVAYCGLINIGGLSGTMDARKSIMEAGLTVLSDSIMIRQKYLFFLQPKWGGTPVDLEQMMSEIERSSLKYNKLRVLLGYRDIMSADTLMDQRSYDKALLRYLEALKQGDFFYYYLRLGDVYSLLQQYNQAVAAYTKAIQIGPVGLRALQGRSYSLEQVGLKAEATKDINLGLMLFPDDKYFLGLRDYANKSGLTMIQKRAYSLIQAGSYTEALKEINLGLSQFPGNKYLLELRDYCNKRQ